MILEGPSFGRMLARRGCWLYISAADTQEGRQQYGGLNVSIRKENAGWTHVSSEKGKRLKIG